MDAEAMNAVLAEMTPEEIRSADWFVDVILRGGELTADEAGEWKRRIGAWQRYLQVTDGDDANG